MCVLDWKLSWSLADRMYADAYKGSFGNVSAFSTDEFISGNEREVEREVGRCKLSSAECKLKTERQQ